jgi:hypothetical protein
VLAPFRGALPRFACSMRARPVRSMRRLSACQAGNVGSYASTGVFCSAHLQTAAVRDMQLPVHHRSSATSIPGAKGILRISGRACQFLFLAMSRSRSQISESRV